MSSNSKQRAGKLHKADFTALETERDTFFDVYMEYFKDS